MNQQKLKVDIPIPQKLLDKLDEIDEYCQGMEASHHIHLLENTVKEFNQDNGTEYVSEEVIFNYLA